MEWRGVAWRRVASRRGIGCDQGHDRSAGLGSNRLSMRCPAVPILCNAVTIIPSAVTLSLLSRVPALFTSPTIRINIA